MTSKFDPFFNVEMEDIGLSLARSGPDRRPLTNDRPIRFPAEKLIGVVVPLSFHPRGKRSPRSLARSFMSKYLGTPCSEGGKTLRALLNICVCMCGPTATFVNRSGMQFRLTFRKTLRLSRPSRRGGVLQSVDRRTTPSTHDETAQHARALTFIQVAFCFSASLDR